MDTNLADYEITIKYNTKDGTTIKINISKDYIILDSNYSNPIDLSSKDIREIIGMLNFATKTKDELNNGNKEIT